MTENKIVDPVLGELQRLDAFTHGRQLSIDGHEMRLVIETAEGLSPEALALARRIVGELDSFVGGARRIAAESLIELKNDTWRGDASELTAEDLERRLSLDECEVATDGEAKLYFSDGGQFGGHSVVVRVDAEGECVDVQLAG